jgi:hypothetical protein
MTVSLSPLSKQQIEALAALKAALEKVTQGFQAVVDAYRLCVEAKCDLRGYLSPSTVRKLDLLIARPVAPKVMRLANDMPVITLQSIVALAIDQQTEIVEKGATVWRDGKKQVIPIHLLRPTEAAALVDRRDGKNGRTLGPDEQLIRRAKPARKDEKIELWFDRHEWDRIQYWARKKGTAAPAFLRRMLREHGFMKENPDTVKKENLGLTE